MKNTTATQSSSTDSRAPVGGLCSTCVHPPGCMYVHLANSPIWRCEEFDDRIATPTSALTAVAPVPERVDAHEGALAATGLCANCDERAVCAHLRRAGSVWHCEEYR